MKILVTGATGLLGNLIARQLVGSGHSVVALVRNRNRAELIKSVATIHYGDLTNPASLKGASKGVDVVVHCAGLVGSGRASRTEYFRANVDGTQNLIEEIKASGTVSRILLLSSVAVYGLSVTKPNVPESTPAKAANVYGESKVAQEQLVQSSGLPYTILRPYWITGGGDRFLIPQVGNLLRHNTFTYIGDGKQQWSLSVAENVADAAVVAALHPKAANQIYNVSDVTLPISETINVIAEALGVPPPTRHSSVVGAGLRSLLSQSESNNSRMTIDLFFPLWRGVTIASTKIRKDLGWSPHVPWQDSVKQGALEWKRENWQ